MLKLCASMSDDYQPMLVAIDKIAAEKKISRSDVIRDIVASALGMSIATETRKYNSFKSREIEA